MEFDGTKCGYIYKADLAGGRHNNCRDSDCCKLQDGGSNHCVLLCYAVDKSMFITRIQLKFNRPE